MATPVINQCAAVPTIGGAVTDIALSGKTKPALLRRLLPYRDGTPSHDHLGDILAALDAEQFQRCFVACTAVPTGTAAEVIAIDGKTLRRAFQKKALGGKKWVTRA